MTPSRSRSALVLFGLGVFLGVSVWVFSPWLTGKTEPWDAEAPIWGLSWLAVAILGGLTGRASGALLPLGYAVGQMLITIRSPFGEFGILGWLFIVGYAFAGVFVALAVAGLTIFYKRILRARAPDIGNP